MPDEGKPAPRHIWEEMIAYTREEQARRLKAAAEGDEQLIRDAEQNKIMDMILKAYADRFGVGYTLPDPLPPQQKPT